MTETMTEMRCQRCDRKLGNVVGKKVEPDDEEGFVELMCIRCKKMNRFKIETHEVQDN